MKAFLSILLLILCNQVYAQQMHIQVLNNLTRLPVFNAEVIIGTQAFTTGINGEFNLENYHSEKIVVRKLGYENQELNLTGKQKDILKVLLKPIPINLNDVNIRAKRNYKLDSLNLRKEYASIFAYQAPRLKDILVKKGYRKSIDPNLVSNSTSSIFSLDLLMIARLLSKQKSSISKLQKVQLKDEELNYVNHHFAADKITEITKLEGDSLQVFIEKYRPSSQAIRKMNDYEILMYIKKSYQDFTSKNN